MDVIHHDVLLLREGYLAISQGYERDHRADAIAVRLWWRTTRTGAPIAPFARYTTGDARSYISALSVTRWHRAPEDALLNDVDVLVRQEDVVAVWRRQAPPARSRQRIEHHRRQVALLLGLPPEVLDVTGSTRLGTASAGDVDIAVGHAAACRAILARADCEPTRRDPVHDERLLFKLGSYYSHVSANTLATVVRRTAWRRFAHNGVSYDLLPRYGDEDQWPLQLQALRHALGPRQRVAADAVVVSDLHSHFMPAGYECRGGLLLLGLTSLLHGTLRVGDAVRVSGTAIMVEWEGRLSPAILVCERDTLSILATCR